MRTLLTIALLVSSAFGQAYKGGVALRNSDPTLPPPAAGAIAFSPSSVTYLDGATLTWSSTNSSSCAGTGFTTSGATSGSVVVQPSSTASYSMSCSGSGGSGNTSRSLAVTPIANPTLTYSTLTNAIQNVPYSNLLIARGGLSPYTWIVSGLPTGLTVNSYGWISGKPTQLGTFPLSVMVTGVDGGTVSGTISLTVSALPAPVGTAITTCNYSANVQNGNYYLSGDLTCNDSGIAVLQSGITIDLQGHTLTYAASPAATCSVAGIYGNTYTNQVCARYGVYTIVTATNQNVGNTTYNGATDGLIVKNGTIVSGSGAGIFSDGVHMNPNTGCAGCTVKNLDITVYGQSAAGIFFTFAKGGETIQNNIVRSSVATVEDRGQLQGVCIKETNDYNLINNPSTVVENGCLTSIQGGIYMDEGGKADGSQDTLIARNYINVTSIYTNDFGIYAYAERLTVQDNVLTGGSRGIHVTGVQSHDSSNKTVSNNQIDLGYTSKQNAEYVTGSHPTGTVTRTSGVTTVQMTNHGYSVGQLLFMGLNSASCPGNLGAGSNFFLQTIKVATTPDANTFTYAQTGIADDTATAPASCTFSTFTGCELVGEFGIQMEDEGSANQNNTVANNNVNMTARSGICPVIAFRLTGAGSGGGNPSNNVIHDNNFVARMANGNTDQGAIAFSMDSFTALDQSQFSFYNNLFAADWGLVSNDFDVPLPIPLNYNNTWRKGLNASASWAFFYNNLNYGNNGHQPNAISNTSSVTVDATAKTITGTGTPFQYFQPTFPVIITGFTNGGNNGTFTVSAKSNTVLTISDPTNLLVNETHSATLGQQEITDFVQDGIINTAVTPFSVNYAGVTGVTKWDSGFSWTYNPTFLHNGTPLTSTGVTIHEANSTIADITTTTDGSGAISVVLPQIHRTRVGSTTNANYTYVYTITVTGCQAITNYTPTAKVTNSIALTCP